MIHTVLKILASQKGKTILGLSGISLAALGFLTILSLSLGFKDAMKEYYRQLDGMYVLKKGAIDPVFSSLNADLEEELLKIEGISAVSPELWDLVSTIDEEKPLTRGLFAFISLGGIDPGKMRLLKEGGTYFKSLEEGKPIGERDFEGAMISRSIAKSYNKKIGDPILIDDTSFVVRGIYRTGSFFLDSALLIHLDKAYDILGKSKKFVSAFYIASGPEEDELLARRITDTIPKISVRRNSTITEDFRGISRTVDTFSYTIAGFAVLFTLVITLNLMAASIRERQKDFGIMICEGWLIGDVVRLVLLEAWILALTGSLLGVGGFFCLYFPLIKILPFTPYCSLPLIAGCLLAGTSAGITGGLFPVLGLGKISPARILRNL